MYYVTNPLGISWVAEKSPTATITFFLRSRAFGAARCLLLRDRNTGITWCWTKRTMWRQIVIARSSLPYNHVFYWASRLRRNAWMVQAFCHGSIFASRTRCVFGTRLNGSTWCHSTTTASTMARICPDFPGAVDRMLSANSKNDTLAIRVEQT